MVRYCGIVRPFHFVGWNPVRVYPLNFAPTGAERAELRNEALRVFVVRGSLDPGVAIALRRAEIFEGESIYWRGIACAVFIVTGSIAAALIMPWWWAMVVVPAAVWRAGRRVLSRTMERGLCGSCRYPLAGLPTRQCPECGHDNAAVPASEA